MAVCVHMNCFMYCVLPRCVDYPCFFNKTVWTFISWIAGRHKSCCPGDVREKEGRLLWICFCFFKASEGKTILIWEFLIFKTQDFSVLTDKPLFLVPKIFCFPIYNTKTCSSLDSFNCPWPFTLSSRSVFIKYKLQWEFTLTGRTMVAVKGMLSIREEARAETHITKIIATAKRWSSGTAWEGR